jgi:hypothetical protein
MSDTETKTKPRCVLLMEEALAEGLTQSQAITLLHKAFDGATKEEVAEAIEKYASHSDDDVEIDDKALTSRADDGVWVMAWVWLWRDPDAVEE